MLRLQDLVDKLQVKVKAYKRQAEEAVSQPPCAAQDSSLCASHGERSEGCTLTSPARGALVSG